MTQPFYESLVNWVIDPAPPASRCPVLEASSAPTPAHAMPPSGDVSQPQDAKSQGEGGEGRLRAQPGSFQLLAKLTSRPRLTQQPMIIRLAGERPSPGQRPITVRRGGEASSQLHLLSSVTASHPSNQSECRTRFLPRPL